MVYQLKLMHFQILRFTVPQNHDGSCLKFTLSFHSDSKVKEEKDP